MSETAISDDDFNQLLVDISDWYDQRCSINMLKVLYRDHVNDTCRLDEASHTMNLLQLLIGAGKLSSIDLTLLYNTIEATEQFGLQQEIKDNLPSRKVVISKFSSYRKKLIKLGLALTQDDIVKISGLYKTTVLKKYADSWCLIMDLEHKKIICEGGINKLIEKLKRSKLHTALDALGVELTESSIMNEPIKETIPKPFTATLMTGAVVIVIISIIVNTNSFSPSLFLSQFSMVLHSLPLLKVDEQVVNEMEGDKARQGLPSDAVIRRYLTERQKKLYADAATMTPEIWNENVEIDIAQAFTDLNLLKSKKENEGEQAASIEKEEKPTPLTKVLDLIKSTCSCKVLITGPGGMGKTMLLRYIAHNWAINSDDTFSGKILFLINVRDIKAGKNILDTIVQQIKLGDISLQTDLSEHPRIIKKFIRKHDDELVFLLDGDELETGAESPISLFKGLEKSTVVLTSRPEHATSLVKRCAVHVKVEGFSPSNIEPYINGHRRALPFWAAENLCPKKFPLCQLVRKRSTIGEWDTHSPLGWSKGLLRGSGRGPVEKPQKA